MYFVLSRAVAADEELLWSFRAVQNHRYTEFDDKAKPCQISVSCQSDPAIPDVPNSDPSILLSQVITPITSLKQRGRGGFGGVRGKGGSIRVPPVASRISFVPDLSPYGIGVIPYDDEEEHQDSDDSEESQRSSDIDDGRIVGVQPVYSDFSFGMVDRKRKITIDWKVQNVVSSNVAINQFVGDTKLNWSKSGYPYHATKTELDCFILMDVPVDRRFNDHDSVLSLTNTSIMADPNKRGDGNMSR